jgi:hypothetical protein
MSGAPFPDPRLRLAPELFFNLCIPARAVLGVIVFAAGDGIGDTARLLLAGILAVVAAGLATKWATVGDNTWKRYPRAITMLGLAAWVLARGRGGYADAGVLVFADAMLGLHSRHQAARLCALAHRAGADAGASAPICGDGWEIV